MTDRLLEWLSFRGNGRIDGLPSDEPGVSPRRALNNLSALAHVELEGVSRWRIAPPVLAGLRNERDEAAAVLCGARTPGVLRRLSGACQSTGARMHVLQSRDGASNIRISSASYSSLIDTAYAAGVRFQADAAYTMLACVPSIRLWPRQPCQMAAGKIDTVRRFSGSRAVWVPSSLSEAQTAAKGFFRIKRDWDWVSIFKSSATDCAYMDDRAGRMLTAAKRRYAEWDSETRSLSFPAHLFPPTLITRALALCTGYLPEFDRARGRISFAGVNAEMLRLALSVTGLRLA